MSKMLNILHLTDIHFGSESNMPKTRRDNLKARRTKIMAEMDADIRELDPSLKPDIIVISGDIGWGGVASDYEEAEKWLRHLLRSTKLSPEDVITCPGNHDINRNIAKSSKGYPVPTKIAACDKLLKIETLDRLSVPFAEFSAFCERMNLPKLQIADRESYLCGSRLLHGIRFNVFNSAWFCRGDNDRGRLCLGEEFLESMDNNKWLVDPREYEQDEIVFSLIHHPASWLRDDELYSYVNRTATYPYLAQRTHVILSGHVHGLVSSPNREASHAYLFTGGAAYANNKHENNFSIFTVDIESKVLHRRYARYSVGDAKWSDLSRPKTFHLNSTMEETPDSSRLSIPDSLKDLPPSEFECKFASDADTASLALFSWMLFERNFNHTRASVPVREKKYKEWIKYNPRSIIIMRVNGSDRIRGYSIVLRWKKEAAKKYLRGKIDCWDVKSKDYEQPSQTGKAYVYTHTIFCCRDVGDEGQDVLLREFVDQIMFFAPNSETIQPLLFGPRQLRNTQHNAKDLGYRFHEHFEGKPEIYTCDLADMTDPGAIQRAQLRKLIAERRSAHLGSNII